MDCQSISEKLSAYIEKQLSTEEKMQIDAHLKTCAKCSLALKDLKKTIEYMQGIEEIEPPQWLSQKVMARVREEAEQKEGIWQKLFYPLHIKLPLEAVATILIAVAAIYVFKIIQPEIKLAKAPLQSENVIAMEELPKQSQRLTPSSAIPKTGIASPSARKDKKEVLEKEVPSEVPKPINKQKIEKGFEVLAEKKGITEEHVDLGKGDRVAQERYKALDMRAGARPPAPESAGMLELKKQTMSMTVYVKDASIAGNEVEKAVKALGGNVIKTESFEYRDILTVRINSQKIEELNKRLQLIGEVKKKESATGGSEGEVEIKIEIIKSVMQKQ